MLNDNCQVTQMKKLLLILMPCLVLVAGCERTMFGVPESKFNALNPQQQQQVVRAYNRQKQNEAINMPTNTLTEVANVAARHSGASYNKSSSSSREHCYMEGNTRVCKQRSSGSSFGIGFN